MTGNEILALARHHFGESVVNSVTAAMELDFLNDSLSHIYSDLPASSLKELLTTSTVSMSSGIGPVTSSWDKIIEVYINDTPATRVNKETIYNASLNDYFTPSIPIFYIDESHVWAVPTDSTVKIVHLAPPSLITAGNRGNEISEIHKAYHPAVADFVASLMYAQEEDIQQASFYRNEYVSKLGNATQQLEAEAA